MFLLILSAAIGFLFIIILISTLIGIPCLPTHRKQARLMIELADIHPGDKVVDLGAGHGRLLFLAAAQGAQATGYELNPFLVLYIWLKTKLKKTPGTVRIKWQSLFKAEVGDADAVFCFLFPGYMPKLDAKLFGDMKAGARIITYVFSFSGRVPIIKKEGVSLYKV